VGDDQDAQLGGLRLERVHAVGHDPQGVDVEAGVGLVEHRDAGLLERELEDLHALLLAARETLVQVARGELARDLDELHRLLDGAAEVLQAHRVLALLGPVRVHDRAEVLGDGDAGDGYRVLEGHEQAHPGALVRVGLGHALAVEQDLALGDLEVGVAHDRVGERGLAGAVRAHQRVHLARVDGQVEPLEDLLLAGPYVEVPDLEVRHLVSLRPLKCRGVSCGRAGYATTSARGCSCRASNSTSSASVVP
jgi:hypothetical protein